LSIIILCGGKSKRFGADKAFHSLGDKTILEIVLDKFKDLSDDIFLQTSDTNEERSRNLKTEVKVSNDIVINKGPLGGIYSGLIRAKYPHVFIIAGDLPFVDRNLLIELEKFTNHHLVIPRWENKFVEPLCALYSKELIPIIKKQLDNNDLKINNLFKIIEKHHARKINIKYLDIDKLIKNNKISSNCFKNINYARDLESQVDVQ
jgi:molybdopterin-guanine dinucleotide biosynthesis protein A